MKIPRRSGSVLLNLNDNRFAVRDAGDHGWWRYGTVTYSDDGFQEYVDHAPREWVIKSHGFDLPMLEPKELGATVDTPSETFVRWTEAKDVSWPWIGAVSGSKATWATVQGYGPVEPPPPTSF